MSPQLGRIGPKAQELVIYVCLVQGENIPQFHLRDLHTRSENFLLRYQKRQINNLKGKCIMEPSTLKHIQRYMTLFELYY